MNSPRRHVLALAASGHRGHQKREQGDGSAAMVWEGPILEGGMRGSDERRKCPMRSGIRDSPRLGRVVDCGLLTKGGPGSDRKDVSLRRCRPPSSRLSCLRRRRGTERSRVPWARVCRDAHDFPLPPSSEKARGSGDKKQLEVVATRAAPLSSGGSWTLGVRATRGCSVRFSKS